MRVDVFFEQSGSLGSLSNDLARWLKQHEEEDDAISPLSKLNPPEPDRHQENHDAMKFTTLQEVDFFFFLV